MILFCKNKARLECITQIICRGLIVTYTSAYIINQNLQPRTSPRIFPTGTRGSTKSWAVCTAFYMLSRRAVCTWPCAKSTIAGRTPLRCKTPKFPFSFSFPLFSANSTYPIQTSYWPCHGVARRIPRTRRMRTRQSSRVRRSISPFKDGV